MPSALFSNAGSTYTTAPGIRERVRYLYGCSEGGAKILHDVPGLTSSCVLEGSLVLPASDIFQAVIQKHLSPEEVCMGIALLLRGAEASLGFLGSSDLDDSRGVGHLVLSSLQYASIGLFCRGSRPFDHSMDRRSPNTRYRNSLYFIFRFLEASHGFIV